MLLAVSFIVALAATGYAYADSEDTSPWVPSGACLGFVVCGMFISAGWWLGFNSIPGMLAFACLTLALSVWRFRGGTAIVWPHLEHISVFVMCVAASALVAAEFYPLFQDGGRVNQLPNIYDLPKHISALSACTRTTQFPVENPWIPNADFAYQTSFYAPFAAVAAAIGSSTAVLQSAACLSPVAAFLLLTIIAASGRPLALSPKGLAGSILLASIVGGYVTALSHPGPALAASLAGANRFGNLPWFEDPFTYLIYVPNHIFAAACLLAAWLETTRTSVGPRGMIRCGLLLAGTVQASGALIPHAVFTSLALAFFHWWDSRGEAIRTRLIAPLSMFACFGFAAGPFALVALRWGQNTEAIDFQIRFNFEGWMTQLLVLGPFTGLFLLGIALAALRGGHWRTYLAIILPGVLFLGVIPHMEISMKSAMTTRLFGVLAAALPLEWVLAQSRTRARTALIMVMMLALGHAAYFSSQTILPLLNTAYIKWDPAQALFVRQLQDLPFTTRIRIAPPSQGLAALSGHNTVMDFTPYRPSAYVPTSQMDAVRGTLSDSARVGAGKCPDSPQAFRDQQLPLVVATAAKPLLRGSAQLTEGLGYILIANHQELQCKSFKPIQPKLVDLGPEPWTPWPGTLPGVTLDARTLTVSSATPVDAGLIKPIRLSAGRYQFRLQVSGKLTGPAHLSLHGKRKLLPIPPGEYASHTFEIPFESSEPVEEVLAFGLGGWGTGAGTLTMERLTCTTSGVVE